MDRSAIARERRLEQVCEALASERARESALRWQLAEIALEAEGAAIDEAAYARLEEDDVALVRSLLGGQPDDELVEDDDWFGATTLATDEEEPSSGLAELEEEIERLLGEIAESQRQQQALERFAAAIDAAAKPPV